MKIQRVKRNIVKLKEQVIELSQDPEFIHHKWFKEWHLEKVAEIVYRLTAIYTNADKDIVEAMIWMHDFDKIIANSSRYTVTDQTPIQFMRGLGFHEKFINKVISLIDLLDRKNEIDISKTPIEVQILSSADGAAHLIGPFFHLYWYENTQKGIEEIRNENLKKIDTDWKKKITLPEIKKAYRKRYTVLRDILSGEVPSI